MMNCGKVQNLLSCYIDRELPGVDMLAIQRHLDQCAECSREYQTLLQVKRLLSEMPVVAPSPTLEERLVQNVLGASPAPSRSRSRWFLPRFFVKPLAIAATAGALALAIWHFGFNAPSRSNEASMADAAIANEVDRAILDAYLSGKLQLRRQPVTEIPLYPYDNRVSLVSVRYYR